MDERVGEERVEDDWAAHSRGPSCRFSVNCFPLLSGRVDMVLVKEYPENLRKFLCSHLFQPTAAYARHVITLLSMPLRQFTWYFLQGFLRPFYLGHQVYFLLFLFLMSNFLLACHPRSLRDISSKITGVLFTSGVICIFRYFCSHRPTSAAALTCQRGRQLSIKHC